jgi:hypothetical protein
MRKLLELIKKEQLPSGGFSNCAGETSLLHTILVVWGMNRAADSSNILPQAEAASAAEILEKTRSKAIEFLLAEKNRKGFFSGNDRTDFFILAVLAETDRGLIGGGDLALVMRELVAREKAPGGPYFSSNKEIDPVVNAFIDRFLLSWDVDLPELKQFRDQCRTISETAEMFFLPSTLALAAAIELEKRSKKKELSEAAGSEQKDVVFTVEEKIMIDKIIAEAEKRFSRLTDEFNSLAMGGIKKIVKKNFDKQMSLMAFYTKEALGEKAKAVDDRLIAQMGLANIFFWSAFVIYDDFWDEDEDADPRLLPVANTYSRSYVDFFSNLFPLNPDFRRFFEQVMDNLDEADSWEINNCHTAVSGSHFIIPDQLPNCGDYEYKFRPSSGHMFGPLAVFSLCGYGVNSFEAKNLIDYFRNYLIGMQINDDIEDWEEDMRRGRISTVVGMLLEDLAWPKKEIDFATDLPELKKVFWLKTMRRAAAKVVSCGEKSLEALKKIKIISNYDPLAIFPKTVAEVGKTALKEAKYSEDFLRSYKP